MTDRLALAMNKTEMNGKIRFFICCVCACLHYNWARCLINHFG